MITDCGMTSKLNIFGGAFPLCQGYRGFMPYGIYYYMRVCQCNEMFCWDTVASGGGTGWLFKFSGHNCMEKNAIPME